MSSRSLIRRISPFFAAGFRQNQRLLSFSSSSADMPEPQSSSPSLDVVHITDNCVQKMKELQADEASGEGKLLRLSIEAGGCSGFQYTFSLDDKTNADDRIFERDGVKLVVDEISFDFVKGATVDYVEELIRSAFQCVDKSDRILCYTDSLKFRRYPCRHDTTRVRVRDTAGIRLITNGYGYVLP